MQVPEPIIANKQYSDRVSVLLNRTVLSGSNAVDFAQDLVDKWFPRCYKSPGLSKACIVGYMIHLTLPRNGELHPGKSLSFNEITFQLRGGGVAKE